MKVLLGFRAESAARSLTALLQAPSSPAGPPSPPSARRTAARCLHSRSSSPPSRGARVRTPTRPRRGALPPWGRGSGSSREAPPDPFPGRAPGGRAGGVAGAAPRGSGAPCSRRPRPAPAPPRAARPLPAVLPARRCPPPARVGGRWVSVEKVNEGGGSKRLTRPGPPAPWTRSSPLRPSPPPGKWPGGGGTGRGFAGLARPRPPRARSGPGGLRAPGRARDRGAGGSACSGQGALSLAGAPRGKGAVYFVRPGRCLGDSVTLRPEHISRVCARAPAPFGRCPRAESPRSPEPPSNSPERSPCGVGRRWRPGLRLQLSLTFRLRAFSQVPPPWATVPAKWRGGFPTSKMWGSRGLGGSCRGRCPGGFRNGQSPSVACFSGVPWTVGRARGGTGLSWRPRTET